MVWIWEERFETSWTFQDLPNDHINIEWFGKIKEITPSFFISARLLQFYLNAYIFFWLYFYCLLKPYYLLFIQIISGLRQWQGLTCFRSIFTNFLDYKGANFSLITVWLVKLPLHFRFNPITTKGYYRCLHCWR